MPSGLAAANACVPATPGVIWALPAQINRALATFDTSMDGHFATTRRTGRQPDPARFRPTIER
jgi:hypothetical protein